MRHRSRPALLAQGPLAQGGGLRRDRELRRGGGGKTLPLHCVSTAFVAKALPFLAAIRDTV